jgi:hypothetical protein
VCFILRTTFPLQFLLFVTRLQLEIGKLLRVREALESSINAGHECRMLRVPNDFRVFSFREISRVALRFKITERIESRSSFAQIGRLESHHLNAREMATPLQSDQQVAHHHPPTA